MEKTDGRITMCGYRCDLCKAFVGNIKMNDERAALSSLWKKYYGLDITSEDIYCEGYRCTKADAKRVDGNCPVRACVLEKNLDNCSECAKYPCEVSLSRKGLSYEEAKNEQGEAFDDREYNDFLLAYDNKTRLDNLFHSKS